MTNDGSLANVAQQFDLDSQSAIMNLLVSVRASDATPEQKNELRDMIFMYMNGGKDPSVRISLEQKLNNYKIVQQESTPHQEPAAEKVSPAPVFGTSRPAPTFTPNSITNRASAEPVEEKTESEPVKVEPPPGPMEEAPKASSKETQTPKPDEVPESEPTFTPEPIPEQPPTPSEPKLPEPKEESTPDVSETQNPSELVSASDGQKRIKEIKAIVNEKIGNPVNLVDIDNSVGREYMTAMLEAMKKVNAGATASVEMDRLEKAFQLVQDTLKKVDTEKINNSTPLPTTSPVEKETTSTSEAQETRKTEPDFTPEPIPEQPTPSEPKVTPSPAPLPQTSEVDESIIEPEPPSETLVEEEPEIVNSPEPEPEPPAPVAEPEEVAVSEQLEAKPADSAAELPNSDPEPAKESAPNPEEIEDNQPSDDDARWGASPSAGDAKNEPDKKPEKKIASLAETKTKLRTPNELPEASSIETSVDGDPLFTKEVDNGLQQLLSEWSIFKKSGLFGTGPKGREHPLFKKIADLQIPLLLAGRFEGATQEIKQSITDYMNGWRYEQGIVYEPGETFEHYLRRVIRHILDLQKSTAPLS